MTIIMRCPCCGGDMAPDKDIGNSIIYKCRECGLSDSKLKEEGQANEKKVNRE
jgi:DNA-directed RNA polymerase subunit M/transcription elongation factor TFIIS